MASQGEPVLGVLEMDVGVLESMAQDGDPEQEMLVVQDELPPQINSEPEMGAAAAEPEMGAAAAEAAVYDTSPSLL